MAARPEVYEEFLKIELPRQGIRAYLPRWAHDKKLVLYEGIYKETDTHKRFLVQNYYLRQYAYYLVPKPSQLDNES